MDKFYYYMCYFTIALRGFLLYTVARLVYFIWGMLLMPFSEKSKKRHGYLQDREFIFRTSDGFRRVRVSKFAQLFTLVTVIGLTGWFSFATFSYVRQSNIISAKHRQIEDLSNTYNKAIRDNNLAYIKGLKEKERLMAQIFSLNGTVADLKKAESMLFERVEELASNEIEDLHKTLAGISPVLASSGLTVDDMLKELKGANMAQGQGGPFIPVDSVALPDKDLNVTYQALNDNLTEWEELRGLVYELPLGKPLKNYHITSSYGVRSDPFTGKKGMHKGMDMGAKNGDSVYATAGGTVVRASVNGLYGNMVEIQHKLGFKTRYAHLGKILVQQGDEVDVGDVIGEVGSTGRSTGPHLHYEIQINGENFNPYSFVKAHKNVF